MADLLACPSCKATLRVPPGAEAIRCPQCKTVVPIAKPPVAKAIPMPAPKAIPLPFDRPGAEKSPPPAVPVAKALPPEKPLVRGKVVDEEAEEAAAERKARKRRRDEDSVKNLPQYERVDHECKMARIGVNILSGGAAASAKGALFFAGFLATVAIADETIPFLLIAATVCLGTHCSSFFLGYIFCLFGPKGMRSTAITGIVVTLLHSAILIPLIMYAFTMMRKLGTNNPSLDSSISHIIFVISSSLNNLNSLTDFPWMIIRSDFVKSEWTYVVMMLVGCMLEFARMSVLGTLVQFYASEGKSHELGYRSLKFVYRIIWVVIVVGVLKLLTIVGFHLLGGENFVAGYFRIPQTLFTTAYFLWWAFAWYEEYKAMRESLEVITAARFLDRRASLDDYY